MKCIDNKPFKQFISQHQIKYGFEVRVQNLPIVIHPFLQVQQDKSRERLLPTDQDSNQYLIHFLVSPLKCIDNNPIKQFISQHPIKYGFEVRVKNLPIVIHPFLQVEQGKSYSLEQLVMTKAS